MTSTRARVLLVAALFVGAACAAWACSSFSGNAAPTNDAGANAIDGATIDAGISTDSAVSAPVDARAPWLFENFDELDGVINPALVHSVTPDDASTLSISDAEAFSPPHASLSYVGSAVGDSAWYGVTFPNGSLDGGVFSEVSVKAKIFIVAGKPGDIFNLVDVVVPTPDSGTFQWFANRGGQNVTITTFQSGLLSDGGPYRITSTVTPGLTLLYGAGWADLELTITFNDGGTTTAVLTINKSTITSVTGLSLDRTSVTAYFGIGNCFSGPASVYLDDVALDYQ